MGSTDALIASNDATVLLALSVGVYNMTTLMQASHQWATRPSDERFTSLPDMLEMMTALRQHSKALVVSSRRLQAAPVEKDGKALMLLGPNGAPVNVTHWSFSQLAQRAGAPAGYLRDLPAPLAADCINYGLQHVRDIEELGVLLHKPKGGMAEARAVTGPNYGRVWNAVVVAALIKRFGNGVTGDFRVPAEFGQRVAITKENTTLYASDRDMWVFLADEDHRIEVPDRRNGKRGMLARGFFVWNSEVGKCTLGLASFLYDYMCGNHIIWGAQGYEEIKIRHSSGAPDRWIEEVAPAIEAYSTSSAKGVVKLIADAKQKRIDDVDKFLETRFTKSQVSAIKAAHVADEDRPIETLWDATVGVTAYARGMQYMDTRVELEREGGKILKLAA
jgi:hypothetical protein